MMLKIANCIRRAERSIRTTSWSDAAIADHSFLRILKRTHVVHYLFRANTIQHIAAPRTQSQKVFWTKTNLSEELGHVCIIQFMKKIYIHTEDKFSNDYVISKWNKKREVHIKRRFFTHKKKSIKRERRQKIAFDVWDHGDDRDTNMNIEFQTIWAF
jgi:hypothetical protein